MAKEKWQLSVAQSKALARLKEQGLKDWTQTEHGAFLRYMVIDALAEVPEKLKVALAAVKPGEAKPTEATVFNASLKEIFSARSICEQANFKKRLVEAGEIKETAVSYE